MLTWVPWEYRFGFGLGDPGWVDTLVFLAEVDLGLVPELYSVRACGKDMFFSKLILIMSFSFR